MRTLLVDNHDSFTYNLFHHLAQTQGDQPEVVVNDDPSWRIGHLSAFDNVVLSPGPGHPDRPADFGICRQVITDSDLPILGVCLGHQGLAAAWGARIRRAPEPRHGRISAVRHDGRDLFAGIPSPFDVVRYHSLIAGDLPPDLVATAWTDDGLLMGLRHRTRPQWGVQFHPESVASTHGHRVLANFRDLTERRGRRRAPATRPSRPPTAPGAPAEPPNRYRVLVREVPIRWPAESAFAALFLGGDHAYWLDSARKGADTGRFSILGDAGGPLGRVATADVTRRTVTVRSAEGTTETGGGFLDWLERDLAAARTDDPGLDCPFALGWVGYLGYELKAECGGRANAPDGEPAAVMVFSDRALVLDHDTGTAHLLALARDGDPVTYRTAGAWLDEAARRLARIDGELPEPAVPTTGEPWLHHDQCTYRKLIDACQQEIAAGESYEICLTTRLEARGDLDPWDGYRRLRRLSPAPYAAFLQFGDLAVLSSSPERFLHLDRDRTARSSPIKGTRPRGDTPEHDRALADELRHSEKDRAENLMIVDLVRNDLGRSARIGTVDASDIFRVRTYAMAHQLVSTVSARLRPEVSAVACVRHAFPPGSMTGAPKIRTMEILDRLENGPRGVYSGAIGYFSLTGTADLSVVIRSAVVTPGRVRYGVGGAVIALSDPAAEFDEILVKSRPLFALLGTGADRRRDGVPPT